MLIAVHGLRDHGSRYGELAENLVAQGFAVYAFDLRGHGHSEGVRVHLDSFEDYLADLGRFLEWVRQQEPGRPVFLFGHSMGGAIVTLFTLEKKPDVQGLVLSAPALKPGKDVSKALIATTKVLGGVLPNLDVLSLDPKQFSRDPAVVKENETAPEGSKALAQRASATDKTLKLYDGLFHDLLHEPEKAQVLGDVSAWLKEHASAAR